MSIKTFFLKQMLKRQGMSGDQMDMFMKMYEKDPELFKKIGKEIEEKTKGGKNQMYASMEVMKKYQNEIRGLMQ